MNAARAAACPLCDAPDTRVRAVLDAIPVRRCASCGFQFAARADVVATRGVDDAFYTRDYFDGRDSSGYAAYEATGATLSRNADRQLARLLRGGPDRERLLEVGSGGGHFLRAAAAAFTHVVGVEICPGICRPVPSNGIVLERALESVTVEDCRGPATAIAMWDVIEHFADPRAAMARIGALAGPQCRLVLSTGDVSSVVARVMGSRWRLLTPLEHYSFFDPASVERLLRTGGFTVERITRQWKWVPVCLVVAQLGRMTGVGRQAWTRVPPSWRVPLTLGDVMVVEARRT